MTNPPLFQYEYPRPALTVDTVVWTPRAGRLGVLLIERAHEPFQGCWALPGGFVNEGERLPDAARRELLEETGVTIQQLWTVGAFGDPGRDPRGWTVSAVYQALVATDAAREPAAGDDAARARWHSAARLPPLAFDHRAVIREAILRLRREIYCLPLARPLLSRSFSFAQLAAVYRLLDPRSPDANALLRRLIEQRVIAEVGRNSGKDRRFRFLAAALA